jgi:RHS repeat-associated protein
VAVHEVQYLHPDHLGSIGSDALARQSITSQTGAWVQDVYFHPYGGIRWSQSGGNAISPTSSIRRTYTGQYDIGFWAGSLMHYNAWQYSPYLNRFIQPDTIVPEPGNPQALNRYSYAYNNPINLTDPSGHEPCDDGSSGSCQSGGRYTHGRTRQGLVRSQARAVYIEVATGRLEPVEGYALIAERAWSLSGGNRDEFMRMMTLTLVGVDPDQGAPSWAILEILRTGRGVSTDERFAGLNLLPYADGIREGTSELGDWDPAIFDRSANQAYHHWFYVAVAYYEGNLMSLTVNWAHDDPLGARVAESLFGLSTAVPSQEDYELGVRGAYLGTGMRTGCASAMAGCQIPNPGTLIRNTLRGR